MERFYQDLVERLTNGPDGGQNELVLAQQFATVAVKVLVENLEIIAPNDIDAEVMAGTSRVYVTVRSSSLI